VKTNLLFVISAPRSGSSLLQQVLTSSNKISTLPEPWIMLPLIQAVKSKENDTLINDYYVTENLINFLNNIEYSKDDYIKKVGEFAQYFYEIACEENAEIFLDKTPRYYHIIPELIQAFPKGKFILLSRNPLSIFASILDYNFNGKIDWLSKKDRLADIYTSIYEIINHKNDKNVYWLRYEDLIENSNQIMLELNNFIGVNDLKIEYLLSNIMRESIYRDNKSLNKHSRPVKDYLYAWKININNSQKKRLAIEYIESLGEDVFNKLGYDFIQTLNNLKKHKVKKQFITLSLYQITNNFGKGLPFMHLFFMKLKKNIFKL
jgi:hypothetical protein